MAKEKTHNIKLTAPEIKRVIAAIETACDEFIGVYNITDWVGVRNDIANQAKTLGALPKNYRNYP